MGQMYGSNENQTVELVCLHNYSFMNIRIREYDR